MDRYVSQPEIQVSSLTQAIRIVFKSHRTKGWKYALPVATKDNLVASARHRVVEIGI
jgi:hypothetical protein